MEEKRGGGEERWKRSKRESNTALRMFEKVLATRTHYSNSTLLRRNHAAVVKAATNVKYIRSCYFIISELVDGPITVYFMPDKVYALSTG